MSINEKNPSTTNPLPDDDQNRRNPTRPTIFDPEFTDEEQEVDFPDTPSPRNPLPDEDPREHNPWKPSTTNPEFTDEDVSDGDFDSRNPLPDEDISRHDPSREPSTPL